MTWRKTKANPLYATSQHRANRKHWAAIKAPCAICGRPIDYQADGRNSRWALHVDHIMPVAEARTRGWTLDQINAPSNSRPTHRGCNLRAGAQLGARRARAGKRRKRIITDIINSRAW